MPTQFFNVTQLIDEALSRIGIKSSGQVTDPEDFSYVQSMVNPTFAELNALEIVPVADQNNIPIEWFKALADALAGACAAKFGVTAEEEIRLVSRGIGGPPSQVAYGAGNAVLTLKQIQRLRPTYEMARAIYF